MQSLNTVAQMAKLVDALCSGRSARKGVLVRIQFWALKRLEIIFKPFLFWVSLFFRIKLNFWGI